MDNTVKPETKPFVVSISPHVRKKESVPKIMWTVVLCLMPALIFSIVLFGWRVLALVLVSVAACTIMEALCQKALKRKVTLGDGSAVLTGVLLAFVLPPGVSFSLPVLGAVMAMFLGKQIFGGLGYNIFNPALLARAFLMVTFPVAMTSAWIMPTPLTELGAAGHWIAALNGMPAVDAVTAATPLGTLSEHGVQAFRQNFGSGTGLYTSFFAGYKPGCIGETSGFLLLLGGLFLMFKRYISWHIPVSMLGTIALLTWIFGGETLFSGDPLLAVLSGGAILGAFFMATDYVTSPSNKMSQLVYGMAIGALTVLIRLKGGYPEGVCYAILLVNPLSTVLDEWFKRKRFSPEVVKKDGKKDTPQDSVKAVETKKESAAKPSETDTPSSTLKEVSSTESAAKPSDASSPSSTSKDEAPTESAAKPTDVIHDSKKEAENNE
ncbi:MAG: RnfABCDGE type electron transport complex subunit D [Proteobacteria bacterium]|nr:RnfABCDGE type electron transport complex subunit D [Pseudomonadota bacterium]